MGRVKWKIWVEPTATGNNFEPDDPRRRQQILGDLDDRGFDLLVCFVAGSGFFTDSYNLFATNVILPCLAFVYWPNEHNAKWETEINLVTLTGSVVGQLVFGFLADKYGRRKLYGLELVFVICGTLGLAQSSSGYMIRDGAKTVTSMSIQGWLIFWRFVVGVGIGAEYPLSAIITAEFAPVKSRARMMASVFAMQALGQLVAALVGLAVVRTMGYYSGAHDDHARWPVTVDVMWRVVVGVGAFPALIAIFFRLLIPESPRFTLDVAQNPQQALQDTQLYLRGNNSSTTVARPQSPEGNGIPPLHLPPPALGDHHHYVPVAPDDDSPPPLPPMADLEDIPDLPPSAGAPQTQRLNQFTLHELRQYFIIEGNWRYLAAASICWFLLDVAFYGLGINNPRTIASIWADAPTNATSSTNSTLPQWKDPWNPTEDIFTVLNNDYIRYIITVSSGSLLGSIVLIKVIDYIPRTQVLTWSFLTLFVLFIVTGASFFRVFETNLHALTITLYVLCQLVFNLGPNSLTFIIPAEIFPTKYRATCHGIAAASGKVGSILIQAIFLSKKLTFSANNSHILAWSLIIYGFLMAVGAFFAWIWLPDVQWPRGTYTDETSSLTHHCTSSYKIPSKTLEVLAEERAADDELGGSPHDFQKTPRSFKSAPRVDRVRRNVSRHLAVSGLPNLDCTKHTKSGVLQLSVDKMCYQISELFSACGCLYHQHAIDNCGGLCYVGHPVEQRFVFVGYTCRDHRHIQDVQPQTTPKITHSSPSELSKQLKTTYD